ncbi:hypothetical protein ACHAWF_014619 [Thalassiosira exigua]
MDQLYEDGDYALGSLDRTDDSALPSSLRGAGSGSADPSDDPSSNEGTPNWLTFAAVLGAWFVAALLIKYCAYGLCRGRDRVRPLADGEEFEKAASQARRRSAKDRDAARASSAAQTTTATESSSTTRGSARAAATPAIAAPPFARYDADFYVKYEDHDGKVRSGFAKIRLRDDGANGYDVGGMCADADGYAVIVEGRAARTGDAWWVREVTGIDEERKGLRVFSTGKFDFGTNRFEGEWVANTGERGVYLKFEGMYVNADADVDAAAATSNAEERCLRGDRGGI